MNQLQICWQSPSWWPAGQTGQEIERAIDEAYRKCMKAKLRIQ